jgi:monoterpene epsilon-lactone hydrolase
VCVCFPLGDPCFSSGDPAADVEAGREWAQQYAQQSARHPECSPYFASTEALVSSLPRALMIVGDEELMLSETTDLAERAIASGVELSLSVYKGMWHVFPMYSEACAASPADVVVEAEDAIDEIAQFVRSGDRK